MKAFRPSWRFSAWVAQADLRARLGRHRGSHPMNLPRCHRALCGLLWQKRMQAPFASQVHRKTGQDHQSRSSADAVQGCARGRQASAHPGARNDTDAPGEPKPVAWRHLFHRTHVIQRQELTHARSSRGAPCPNPLNPDHREQQLTIVPDTNLIAVAHPGYPPWRIGGFSRGSRVALRCWASSLQQWPGNRRATRRNAITRLAGVRAMACQAAHDALTRGLAGPHPVGRRPTIVAGATAWRASPSAPSCCVRHPAVVLTDWPALVAASPPRPSSSY